MIDGADGVENETTLECHGGVWTPSYQVACKPAELFDIKNCDPFDPQLLHGVLMSDCLLK